MSQKPISRRRFLKALGAGSVAAGLASFAPFRVQGQETLSILLWSHFVPRHDEWFDNVFVPEWGEKNNVQVKVDHIGVADVPAAIAAEIAAGSGHDIQEYIAPMPQHEPSVHDLSDVIQELESRYGDMLPLCKGASINPFTGKAYAFSHGFVIDPMDYRKSLWEQVGKPEGPDSWQDILVYGAEIFRQTGIPVGLGLSQEIDTNMATRTCMWAHDASVQNETGGTVTIDSPETREAVQIYTDIFREAMTPEVFNWTAASNNQALIGGRVSLILNSISAYRSAQKDVPEIAKDIFFTKPVAGPRGSRYTSEHVLYNMIVPSYVPARRLELAKQFMIDLEAAYADRMWFSELYDTFAFPGVPAPQGKTYEVEVGPDEEGRTERRTFTVTEEFQTVQDLFDAWFDEDPFSLPGEDRTKLRPLKEVLPWSVAVGFPGPTNPAAGEVFATFVIPNMFARVARGDQTIDESVRQAHQEAVAIYERWKEQGLIPPE